MQKGGSRMQPVNDCTQEKVANYINYLTCTYHLTITIHFKKKYNHLHWNNQLSALGRYYDHMNPYCFYVKNALRQQRKCWLCQGLMLRKCTEHEKWLGSCWADVQEYVHRFWIRGEVGGAVCVTGYRDCRRPYGGNAWYDENMKDEPIPQDLLDVVIPPLCSMLTDYLSNIKHYDMPESVYAQVLDYIQERHGCITLDELSRQFHYSKSYLSHMFRRENGNTLKSYCNLLKIEAAKQFLIRDNLEVTEVALSVGFNNLSYFIHVFKTLTGESPSTWRKHVKQTEYETG